MLRVPNVVLGWIWPRRKLLPRVWSKNGWRDRGRMRARTLEEMQAYADGYNACAAWFESYLIKEKSVEEAIRKMEILRETVNSVVRKEK
ncbi:MAG: hypothetical protein IKG37_04405 [Solobacterium sp.]|nr:hypothetical protein [Solobacterium sp.]